MKADAYRKELARGLRGLRRRYRGSLRSRALRANEAAAALHSEWLRDNYYMLERETRQCLRELRSAGRMGAGDPARALELCRRLCAPGHLPTAEAMREALPRERLTGAESELLPLALRCVLAEMALQSVRAAQAGKGEEATARISGAVKGFRALPDLDLAALLEQLHPVERILRRDPAGIYPRMEEGSRAIFRSLVARRAQKGMAAEDVARILVEEAAGRQEGDPARHIGVPLLRGAAHPKRGKVLFWLESLLPLPAAAGLAWILGAWYAAPLFLLPLWAVCRVLLEFFLLRGLTPVPLPRMELGGEIPPEGRTLIVVSNLLPEAARAKDLERRMEELHGSNGGKNIAVCVLADFKGAASPVLPQDAADIAAARRAVERLNKKYGGSFVLALRPRVFSPTMGNYCGWERKRGAILQLAQHLRGASAGASAFLTVCGDQAALRDVRYILALDADTQLPLATAAELVAIALHPANRPRFDPALGRVTEGYGILAPQVGLELESARATPFAHAMAGEGGVSPYSNAASERYQDLFGSGVFAGKGLIDVDAFLTVSEARPFPAEQVLSHDVLEGALLRTGFVADVQVMDGFPAHQRSYFMRQERWVRGDWQNLSFLRKKSGLPALSRYQLFDNLRRSLLPPLCLAAAMASLLAPRTAAIALCAAAVLGICGAFLFSAIRSLGGGFAMLSRQYYAGGLPAGLGDLVRGFLQLLLLAQTAWINAAGAVRGLWRSLVSRKRRLEWTTAAQGEGKRGGKAVLSEILPSSLAGALLLCFGKAEQRLIGFILLADLLFAPFSGRKVKPVRTVLGDEERERLTGYCAAMWNYFDVYCAEEHNHLPPDNVQESPVFRVAPRTSPTNIGLYLLCVLAARDLDLITTEELLRRVSLTLESVERLERWNGNLLNWYDTRSLAPLEPRYVSTVDSGNFLCSLRVLRRGLGEYAGEAPALLAVCERLCALEDACDLRPLYHARRRLFHIGVDLSTGKPSPSYYDLLMSEARMTGYYAIARRWVSKKHWGALGRTLASSGRFTGPVSWTGTMFEYFMPYLFLPAPRGTLGYEALRFALACQQKRVRGRALPWGNSESGFFAFDGGLNYQYKAHGVQKLGLRRDLDEELVLAPYAAFLAMQLAPRAALANLRRFEHMELWGKCGFYEAADATPGRTGGQDYAVVRSYMAHHVGMSLLSALNTLQDGVLRRRFMADEEMASAASLLYERIPDRAAVFRDVELRETRRPQERFAGAKTVFTQSDPGNPRAQMLTNGEWSCVLTDCGAGVSFYRGVSVFRHSPDLLRRAGGVLAFLREEGQMAISLGAAPQYAANAKRVVEFAPHEVTHRAEGRRAVAAMRSSVHPRLPAEERRFTLRNTGKHVARGQLILYFEPSLAPLAEEAAHPAFSKLFLEDVYDSVQGVLTFTRHKSGGESISLAAALSRGTAAVCERSRIAVWNSGAGEGIPLPQSTADGTQRGNPDCCGTFLIPYVLQAGETRAFSLYLCAGSAPEEAVERLHRLRTEEENRRGAKKQGAPCPFRAGGMAAALAESVLPRLLYYAPAAPGELERRAVNHARRQTLWALGVSGDEPYLYYELRGRSEAGEVAATADDACAAQPYLSLFRSLRGAGVPCEMVLAYQEGGDYDTPVLNALQAVLRRENCQHACGRRGGVHLVNLRRASNGAAEALAAYAAYIAGEKPQKLSPCREAVLQLPLPAGRLECAAQGLPAFAPGSYSIPAGARSAVPWCLPLCNRSFGTLVSRQALGFTWAVNARENKLSPWYNDPCTDNRGELLLLRVGRRVFDLLQGAHAEFSPAQACWRGEVQGFAYAVTVTVPERGCVKRCEVQMENRAGREQAAELVYYVEPVLGVRREPNSPILGEALPDGALLQAPDAAVRGYAALLLSGGADFVCTDRAAFWKGQWAGGGAWPQADPCAAVGRRLTFLPGGERQLSFSLGWGAKRNAALCAHLVAERDPMANARAILEIQTPDAALNHMINTWLPHQILHSRLFGRTGFSQCGGAWGFRDQLQDVSALILTHPALVRVQLYRCAAAQFPEGDGLHWWHRIPGEGIRGVRTRYSDDFLWLPYVCGEYVLRSGDASVLEKRIPFREGEALRPEEHERYAVYPQSAEKATLYTHCIRAVERTLQDMGAHGLPRMGGGDWNDGFNLVGAKGRGESVWLAMFFSMVLESTAQLCRLQAEPERAERYRDQAQRLREAIESCAWAGDRYLRAFWDDGTPMGGEGNEPCAIDILPQAFASLCGLPDADRRRLALDTAMARLVDHPHRMVRLLRVPFPHEGKRAGYINAYPAGIRENGGQYTHAAVWLCLALFKEGRAEDALSLLQMLNPAAMPQDSAALASYRGEPYALAGDVSAAPGIEGQAGWTFYTGAAAWYYRAVLEGLLGLRERDGRLVFENPCLPEDWQGKVHATLRLHGGEELTVQG
ncbi:MAG: DUF3131 domain-containing protein [Oscillospiraceae bacterium]|jgi:cyclic beta-1,2-glucan synthetase|nr:DUF3131 domain-containing protein [Oscillospiraceae bacterium]